MSTGLKKLQPKMSTSVSERTLVVEVELLERKERGRQVTQIGTDEVLEYLEATKTPYGKLLSGPKGRLSNRDSAVVGVWKFEKKDLRVKHQPAKTSPKKTSSKEK